MSYLHDDDQTEISSLRDLIENLQSQILDGAGSSGLENVDSGVNLLPASSPGTRHSPSNNLPTDLGNITSPLVIDFRQVNNRLLIGNVNGNTTITFKNIPVLLEMTLRLYVRSTDPIITIDGTIASGVGSSPLITTAVDDFLDISLSSTDQLNVVIGTVKKNDETEIPPDPPQNINVIGNSASTIKVTWDQPIVGSLPILYDVAFSTSSAESAANDPDTHATGSPDNNIAGNMHEITGLSSATTYYVWIRAHNDAGTSDYIGPTQTNTEGVSNPGSVNFAIPGGTILWSSVTIEWDNPGGLFFTLTRTDVVSGEVVVLQDRDAAAVDIVDSVGIKPETDYDYKLTVYNGFGAILGSATINVDTPTIPAPTVVFENVGTRLKFTVTMPANINVAYVEWALDNSVDGDGFFDAGRKDSRQITRPIGTTGETDVIFTTGTVLADTLYYGHAKLQKNEFEGAFSSIASDTTNSVNPPSKPGIAVTSPSIGNVRIKLDYNDTTSTGEWIVVSYRISTEVGPYTAFDTYFRDEPPADDLDVDEDEIEVIRSGFTPAETFTFRAEAFNQSGPSTAGGDSDNVLVDS